MTMSSVPGKPSAFTFCAKSFVFGASTASASITDSRPSRWSCDRIDAMPARYILRLTFCEKFSSGKLGKILPPPRHSGLLAWPARARPVPFCAQGFLCDLLTSAAALLLARAAPGIRLVRRDELMDQRLVVVAAEQRVRSPRRSAPAGPCRR
mgnify:CR=1 FL=1